ncbi:TPA: amidohydrolase [Burkholderia aenigmatica]|uniref:M20 aminoacylase family protein n=1 Tax=Burkholderia sp. AU45251 TaxID=3059204 RepID=UPI00265166E4|nr:M20 aminoacylase family protein [Burkholderia sp. AU45251]HDR9481832.1 amidohydrolase [Burkholderia aenigmatica]MDN7513542.1 M20 aminoacylase family protein [Burkholderia sp. AU45251]HDR9513359.1 amidohydrolase [Burkholderia aenigmatica]HDR9590203.1 amidohydrolase [Burkholderia aenigmatica]HDR9601810.1 amidohydrolase [Burkholderia aenigmatica]
MLLPDLSSIPDLQPLGDDLRKLRYTLHCCPELAFEEVQTAEIVATRLKEYGYTVATGIAGTGVVGTLRLGSGKRRIGIRADIDALPIDERNTFDHKSRHPGRMHACGHDGHTAMLLGAARHLAQRRRFDGTVHLIFQPAEERGFDSGARRMVEQGLFTRFPCDAVFAMHNHPGAPAGTFMFRTGPFMAAGDRVFVKIIGKGGHAARPHLANDPIVAAGSIVMALQTIVSRNVDPTQSAVVTIGKIAGGSAPNVIPGEVELSISVRSFDADVRRMLKERITALVHAQADSYGLGAVVDYVEGYPVVTNSAAETELAIKVAKELVGDAQVTEQMAPLMGSEDFAYMLQACPGSFLRIGNGPTDGGNTLHSATYDFNDENLVVGSAFWSRLVERYLPVA